MLVKCEFCGKNFNRKPAKVRFKHNFCTLSCCYQWRRRFGSWNKGLDKSDPRVEKNVINATKTKRKLIREGTLDPLKNFNLEIPFWSDKEISILKEEYPIHGTNIPELREQGRTRGVIKTQAYKLRIKKRDLVIIEPSKNLSYILGVLITDASIDRKRGCLTLTTTEKNFANAFYYALAEIGFSNHKRIEKRKHYSQGFAYNIYGCRKAITDQLLCFTYDDMFHLVKGYDIDFLRGVIDGDGDVNRVKHKHGTKFSFYLRIRLKKDGYERIKLIEKCFRRLNYHPRVSGPDKREFYALHLLRQEEVYNALNEIKPTIERRQIKSKISEVPLSRLLPKLQALITAS